MHEPDSKSIRSAHWQKVYSTRGEADVSWYQARPETSLSLLLDGLDRSAAIIDVGGGASRLVDHLLDAGYENIAVLDIAAAGLAQAQARLGERAAKVEWIVADIAGWQPERKYDAWHDRAVFHFLVDAEVRAAYRQRLLMATNPGARIVIGTFALHGPERCSGLPVRRYSAEMLARELGDGFELREELVQEHQTPGGRMQPFQFAVFERKR